MPTSDLPGQTSSIIHTSIHLNHETQSNIYVARSMLDLGSRSRLNEEATASSYPCDESCRDGIHGVGQLWRGKTGYIKALLGPENLQPVHRTNDIKATEIIKITSTNGAIKTTQLFRYPIRRPTRSRDHQLDNTKLALTWLLQPNAHPLHHLQTLSPTLPPTTHPRSPHSPFFLHL